MILLFDLLEFLCEFRFGLNYAKLLLWLLSVAGVVICSLCLRLSAILCRVLIVDLIELDHEIIIRHEAPVLEKWNRPTWLYLLVNRSSCYWGSRYCG